MKDIGDGLITYGGVGATAIPEASERAMSKNFHEGFAGGEVKPPTERATGLVFVAVALIVALLWRNSSTVLWVALGSAATLAIVSLLAPALLKPLNMLWFRFGLLLHRIVNPIVMFAIFALVFCSSRRHHASLARSLKSATRARCVELLD